MTMSDMMVWGQGHIFFRFDDNFSQQKKQTFFDVWFPKHATSDNSLPWVLLFAFTYFCIEIN